jgi:hypothetical protein
VDQDDERLGPGPAIRAIQTRTIIEAMENLPTSQLDAIVARASPQLIERARRSFALAWLPIDPHMQLCEVIYDVVGRDAFMTLQGEAFAVALQTPMLRGILRMIGRVSDDAVALLLRNAPRLYGHVTRDVGHLEGRVAAKGSGTIDVTGWPAGAGDFEVWLVGTQACIRGSLDVIGATAASLELERSEPARGFGRLRVRW